MRLPQSSPRVRRGILRLEVRAATLCLAFVAPACNVDSDATFATPAMSKSAAPLTSSFARALSLSSSAAADASGSPLPTPAASSSPQALGDGSSVGVKGEVPRSDSPVLAGHIALLWAAIVSGDPAEALPAFYPLSSYEKVKAVANPGADWKRRLVAAYERDIRALHKKLGDDAAEAKFVRFEIPRTARWMNPGQEGNKLGYYRVLGAKLVYQVGGRERSFDVTSLISSGDEWYVVHLSGFR